GLGQLLGLDLVPHGGDGVGAGADKGDARLVQGFLEGAVFREEAVAGVHGLGPGLFAGGDDFVDHQIAFGRGGGADAHRFIRQLDVKGVAVGVGIHGNGGNAHALGGLEYAAGDFTAVCYEDFFEHGRLVLE